jgi:tRNA 2-thiouridine synthesizing protein C
MTAHILFLSAALSTERLSVIEEMFKARQGARPDPAAVPAPGAPDTCRIFLTGDAVYSLGEGELQQTWRSILSFSGVRVICDPEALGIRGYSAESLRGLYPPQTGAKIDCCENGAARFWESLAASGVPPVTEVPPRVGWLEISSPYMNASPGYGIRTLSAALDAGCATSLYAFLDGCHISHTGQRPEECANIGEALADLARRAGKKNLPFTIMVNRNCAAARGYATWDDGQGTVVSLFAVKNAHIRDLESMVQHIGRCSVLLGENAGSVSFSSAPSRGAGSGEPGELPVVPLLLFVTHPPYGTEHMYGALTLAAACAHQGIPVRVVFCEDGVYALAGEQRPLPGSDAYLATDLIGLLSLDKNIRFYALTPSIQKRGFTKNAKAGSVTEIGYAELAGLAFTPPVPGKCGDRQRILMF